MRHGWREESGSAQDLESDKGTQKLQATGAHLALERQLGQACKARERREGPLLHRNAEALGPLVAVALGLQDQLLRGR